MKKRILLLFSILLLLCGCKKESFAPYQDYNEQSDSIDKILSEMTIDEKIGQMLIIRTPALVVDDNYLNLLNKVKPSGIIIYGGNIDTFNQTKTFISDVKKIGKIPMIISVDEEGGDIQKIQYIKDKKILSIPSMYDLGKTNDEELSYQLGIVLAQELKTLGINMTFAPVLDIYNPSNQIIGTRSFGDKETTTKMAISFAKGIESQGIIPTYKHFPGHGSTSEDSHQGLPIINKTYEELLYEDLVPFKAAIENDAKIIMIGHLAYPNITGDNIPASLSKKLITDILRNDLNYDGLIITDALDMGALINNYTDEEIAAMAINAGVDLLLMPRDIDNIIGYIKNNVPEERINESAKKILTFKYTYLTNYELLDESYLNSDDQKQIVAKVK